MTNNKPEKLVDIRVYGVGGGGSNAVTRMYNEDNSTVEYFIINTDKQALETEQSKVLGDHRLCIGESLTKGLGAGAVPEQGKKSAEESKEQIMKMMQGANMVFVTAGMGGGTGTGAVSVVAGIAKEMGILTIGVVTKPFSFEGKLKLKNAEEGIAELEKNCDTLIVVPNDRLLKQANKNLNLIDSFKLADDVLKQAILGISDLIIKPGIINVDFADVTNTIKNKGTAHVGIGLSDSIAEAVNEAIDSPLLETSIEGSTGLLINFASGHVDNLNLIEVHEAASLIESKVAEDANIIFGTTIDPNLDSKVKVTVIATGFDASRKKEDNSVSERNAKEETVAVEKKEPEKEIKKDEMASQFNEIPSFLLKKRN